MIARGAIAALALLAASTGVAEIRPAVSIRATTAAIEVTGGAGEPVARLYDADGSPIDGLLVERDANRTSIVLVASVRPGARIEARVPGTADLSVEASNGGPVTVRGVQGQLQIQNANAAIVLERVGGAVLAATSNGSIDATLVAVDPALPTSLLTSNGAITLTAPAGLRANLRLESDTGPLAVEYELAGLAGIPRESKVMRGGRLRTILQGAVNGGGPDIELRTENAPITVRRQR